jgi:hypothetical protein
MSVRRPVQIGDVFAVRSRWAEGLLGRVVSTGGVVGPTHGCNLVYVYRAGPSSARLSRDRLLAPPMMTTRTPWSRKYFEFVESVPLLPGDYFERHCFRDAHGSLYDEESRPLATPSEPIGEWRLFEEVEALEEVIGRSVGRAPG